MTLPPPPSPEEKSSKNINLFERLKENSVFDISPISNPPSSQEIFGQYQIIPKISPSTPQEEEKKEIWIRIYLISRRWFLLRLVFIGGFSLAVFLLYQGIPLFLDLELFPLVQQRHLHYSLWLGFSLYLISFYAIPLFRRKYLVVFPPQGRLGFFGSFFGPRKYSFSEVANIEFEVDMTHTLKELQAFELCRIYLRLVNRKLLLVTEGLGQKKMADLAEFLADHLKVVVHPFHRIGIKRYTEISLGRYKVLEELSHGGMGKVFLARDQENDRLVALKILPARLALEGDYRKNFAREIRILQKLSHPHIVPIYDIGRHTTKKQDVYFFAMEFIQGKNLSDLIPQDLKEEIPYKRIATFIFQCATALDYIHKMHIIHRDIKPSNIMIKEGDQAVLIDFGIAKEATQIAVSEELMDRTFDRSHVKGSPAYMSPEQFRLNQSIDARTDIYSLGVTFYQLLTGNLPLQGGMTTLGQKASHWMPADPRNINPKIPAPLEMIILKAMEKDKKNRYTYASEMAEDLQLWLHDKPIRSAQLSTLQRWKRRLKRLTQYFWRSSSSSSSPPPSA